MSKNKDLQNAREKFYEGPASDYQSFHQYLINQGRPDLVDADKKSTGGREKMAEGTKKEKDKKKKIQGVIRFSGSDMLDLNPEKFVKNLSRTILEQSDRTKKSAGGLTGNQKKLDKNKDGKITGQDFKMLRDKKSAGGRVKLSKGTPNPALMDATSNRATNAKISRGGGAAVRGVKFKGVF
tara:strand:- start:1 stop:543 length:543 start_codon:yes stop_codon:yes gene_type:complete